MTCLRVGLDFVTGLVVGNFGFGLLVLGFGFDFGLVLGLNCCLCYGCCVVYLCL